MQLQTGSGTVEGQKGCETLPCKLADYLIPRCDGLDLELGQFNAAFQHKPLPAFFGG